MKMINKKLFEGSKTHKLHTFYTPFTHELRIFYVSFTH